MERKTGSSAVYGEIGDCEDEEEHSAA